jgi:hypothetical protein
MAFAAALLLGALPRPAGAATGALIYQDCITSNSNVSGCTAIPGAVAGGANTGLDQARTVAVSADGKSVYSLAAGAVIARFDRDAATGALTYQGCITSNTNAGGCTTIPFSTAGGTNTGLSGLASVAVSADGMSVYTSAVVGDAVARFDRDPATGALSYVGCMTSNSNITPCTAIPGAVAGGVNTALDQADSAQVSADGKSLYTASTASDAVARFDRSSTTGALTYQGCISSDSNVGGCGQIPGAVAGGTNTGLSSVISVVASADGTGVYTASPLADAVARFDRTPATGAPTYQDCSSSNTDVTGCTMVPGAAPTGTNTGLNSAFTVAASADGKSVYAAATLADAVARFDRDPATGALTYQDCIGSNSDISGCAQIPGAVAGGANTGLDNVTSIASSADGRSVYAASQLADAVARFDRDPATGALAYQDCIGSNSDVSGCAQIPGAVAGGANTGLDQAGAVAVSADGMSVYTSAVAGDAVARFDRELPPPPPPVEPSNQFSFGKLKRDKRKGTAKLTVEVPGPGKLTLAGKNLKAGGAEATAAREVELPVKAKGKGSKKLRERGKLKLTAQVTFTPTGGTPNTQAKKLKLIRRR